MCPVADEHVKTQQTFTGEKRIRPLGYAEARMYMLQSMYHGTTQGALAVRIEGNLSVNVFESAVRDVKRRYEILNSVIAEDETGIYFVQDNSDQVPISFITRRLEHDWVTVLERENRIPLDPERELWRIVLVLPSSSDDLPIYDIIVIVHHAIMDGTAADTFLDEILEICAQDNVIATPAYRNVAFPPSAEISLPERLRITWDEFSHHQQKITQDFPQVQVAGHACYAPIERRVTRVTPMEIVGPEYQAVSDFCATKDITFNSYVSAALVKAVHEHSVPRKQFVLHTTFSLRRLCGIQDRDIGCYMTVIPTFHDFSNEGRQLADIAADHQRGLAKAILKGTKHPSVVNVEKLRQSMQSLSTIDRFIQDIGYTYGESRLRECYGALYISHIYTTVNRSLGNLAIVVHGIKINNRVYFTVNYTSPLQEDNWMVGVTSRFMDLLRSPPRQ